VEKPDLNLRETANADQGDMSHTCYLLMHILVLGTSPIFTSQKGNFLQDL